jgi:mannonate dehydratase
LLKHYRCFREQIVPVAEESGVTLALHPNDQPVPILGGVARLFRSGGSLEEALDVVPSERSATDLCLGIVSKMGGKPTVLEAFRALGPRNQLAYVHFRDVQGSVPTFAECFPGDGNRPLHVMRALRDNGFTGFILDNHAPGLVDDSDYGHLGRAHLIGYIQGLLEAICDGEPGIALKL